MDIEGNIYDLKGNFIGTTDGDGGAEAAEGDSQMMMDDNEGQYVEGEEYWNLIIKFTLICYKHGNILNLN